MGTFISCIVCLEALAALLSAETVSTVVRWFSSISCCSLTRIMLFSTLSSWLSYSFFFFSACSAAVFCRRVDQMSVKVEAWRSDVR